MSKCWLKYRIALYIIQLYFSDVIWNKKLKKKVKLNFQLR